MVDVWRKESIQKGETGTVARYIENQRHIKSDRTFRVVQHTRFQEETQYWGATCYPLADALRNDFHEFADVTQTAGPFNRMFAVDRGQSEVFRFEEEFVLFADTAFASVFDIEWLAGSRKEALKMKNSVVLTEQAAAKCFSATEDYSNMLGRVIMLEGKDPLTVTGIIRNAPGNTSTRYSMIVPYQFFKENNQYQSGNWSGNYGGRTFVVLDDPSKKQFVEEKIATWKKKYLKPDDDARISYVLQPLGAVHTETLYGKSKRSYTMPATLLSSAKLIGLIVLVIAAVNFVNLSTATASTRSKEIGIRKVLGTSRAKLIGQFLYEHTLCHHHQLAGSLL